MFVVSFVSYCAVYVFLYAPFCNGALNPDPVCFVGNIFLDNIVAIQSMTDSSFQFWKQTIVNLKRSALHELVPATIRSF